MKHIKFSTWILMFALAMAGCKKEEITMGELPDPSQIEFEIKQDLAIDAGGNTVILINKTPGTIPIWDYGTGKSNRQQDTIRFAFAGEYTIKFSADTRAGIVEKPAAKIKVTKDNLNYVNNPLWTLLSGGVGNEKTWYLDANAAGDKKKFTSPIYFAGQDNAYGSMAPDGKTVVWSQVCSDPTGPNCWTYAPNYTSDTWAADKRDYGFMTFSLKGGPFLKTDHKGVAGVGTQSGTYFLDVNTLILSTTDATPLSVSYTPGDVVSVYSWRILSISEDFMQLAVKNKTKAEYQVLNYISKSYSDSWVPPPPPTPKPDDGYNPTFAPGEILAMLTGGTGNGRFWQLDGSGNPVDWIAKGNGWTANKSSSYNWGWNESWDDAIKNSWIRFDNIGGQNYTRFQGGVTTTGTFTINEATNQVTLVGNTLLQNAASWMNPTTNVLKIVKGWNAAADYKSKGIWFGTGYDAGKDEWFSFHYVIP